MFTYYVHMKTKDFVLKLTEMSSKITGYHCKQILEYIINRITRKGTHASCNIAVRLCNTCYSAKAMSIT